MSRKTLKKILKRLQEDAFVTFENYRKMRHKTAGKSANARTVTEFVLTADSAILALYDYAKALEDAYSELAEPFDKKLEAMEKAMENIGKPVEKKEEAKKPSYRV